MIMSANSEKVSISSYQFSQFWFFSNLSFSKSTLEGLFVLLLSVNSVRKRVIPKINFILKTWNIFLFGCIMYMTFDNNNYLG